MNKLMGKFFSDNTQEAATGDPIAKAVVVGEKTSQDSTGETKNATSEKNSFTYDDGTGVKDTVKLTGPLSEVYTRMLNISLAKKDPLEGETEPSKNSAALGVESQQTDDKMLENVIAAVYINDKDREIINNKFNFVDESQLTQTVDTIAHLVDATDAFKPETIYELTNGSKESNDKKILVVLVADQSGITQGMRMKRKFVELSDDPGTQKVFGTDVRIAAEALYKPFGVRVVFGIEGLLEALKKND